MSFHLEIRYILKNRSDKAKDRHLSFQIDHSENLSHFKIMKILVIVIFNQIAVLLTNFY
jgi:hypothetical protein